MKHMTSIHDVLKLVLIVNEQGAYDAKMLTSGLGIEVKVAQNGCILYDAPIKFDSENLSDTVRHVIGNLKGYVGERRGADELHQKD